MDADAFSGLLFIPDGNDANGQVGIKEMMVKNGSVVVFSADYDENADGILCRTDVLDGAERKHAERIIQQGRKTEFILSRLIIKHVIHGNTGTGIQAIEILKTAEGKPYVSPLKFNNPGPPYLFSLSHTTGRVAAAFSRGLEIGIDVQRIDREWNSCEEIARRFFTRREYARLCAGGEKERVSRFFTLWTLKEALLKALGRGLGMGLNHFDIDAEDLTRTVSGFRLFSFRDDDYCLSLAVQDTDERVCIERISLNVGDLLKLYL